jgi:hypothetical protein
VQAIGDGAAEPGFTGVRMDLLAGEALGSPQNWRPLALHNGIDNPLEVPSGTVLAVPPAGVARSCARSARRSPRWRWW